MSDTGSHVPGGSSAVPRASGASQGIGSAPLSRKERRQAKVSTVRGRRVRWLKRSVLAVALLVVLAVASEGGFLYYEAQRLHRTDTGHSITPISGGVENILMVGSTTRCGLNGAQSQAFGTCEQASGVNSDVVMILHLDSVHHRVSILSIPRDTFVPNARLDGSNKIDAALGDPEDPHLDPIVGDPAQLINAVQEDFGIPINHFVELNFDTFQGVVQALGSIKMYFPMAVYDQYSDLSEPAGCDTLGPFQALALVRSRHLYYQPPSAINDPPPRQLGQPPPYGWVADPESDLARIRRDHEFLRVLASAVSKNGLSNPVTDDQLINAVAPDLTVDSGFSTSDLVNLVLAWHSTNPQTVPQYTLPVSVYGNPNGYDYGGGGYGDVVFPVQPEDSQVISQFLGTSENQAPGGQQLPAPSSITVSVENATGRYNQGSQTAAALGALGFNIGTVTDTPVKASVNEAVVLYSDPSKLDDALAVQKELNGIAIVAYDPGILPSAGSTGNAGSVNPGANASTTSVSASTGAVATEASTSLDVPGAVSGIAPGQMTFTSKAIDVGTPLRTPADVVLVTGSNFSVDQPPAPATATTQAGAPQASSPSSSTTSAPSSASPGAGGTGASSPPPPPPLASNPDLGAPSASVTPLQPWDPRSCTASGGPGP